MSNEEDNLLDTEILKPEDQASSAAIEAIERSQLDVQIMTAKKNPRTLSKVKADMLSFATLDTETAMSCYYKLPRGGKEIEGPSIRMAEIAISCYGNMRVGSRILEVATKGDHPHVLVQAVAHDLEKNTAVTMEKRRRIVGKKSKGGVIDDDDINLAANACSAIAIRDAAFKVIPGALIKPVWQQAKAVALKSKTPMADKRSAVIKRLNEMHIETDRILAVCGVPKEEDINLDMLDTLIGLGTAIKDGMTTAAEAFPPVQKFKPATVTPGAVRSPNAELADIVSKECNAEWPAFFTAAVDEGWLPDSSEAKGFDDVPAEVAQFLIANKATLVKALKPKDKK